MKIAGIAGKHPQMRKGDIIQLSAEDKVKSQAKQELSDQSEEGYKFLCTKAVIVGSVQEVKGRQTKDPEPNQYIGTVLITYRPLRLSDDRLFPEKSKTVKIHCCDCTDDLGMPDLKTLKFDVLD